MRNDFPSRQEVAITKANYPPGTRIQLNHMDDAHAPVPPGTCGTVMTVDGAGHLLMKWDNGRTLAAIPGVDSFHKLDPKLDQGMGGMKL